MNNFDFNPPPWRRIQDINKQIADLEKEREQISKNSGTTPIPGIKLPIPVPPPDTGGSKGTPWGWIIVIGIILLILAGQGNNNQPSGQPNSTQSAPTQSK